MLCYLLIVCWDMSNIKHAVSVSKKEEEISLACDSIGVVFHSHACRRFIITASHDAANRPRSRTCPRGLTGCSPVVAPVIV